MRRTATRTALALALALASAGCRETDPVILRLQGETVRRSQFERHLAALEAQGEGTLAPEARRGVLEAFLEQQALAIEARKRGLLGKDASPEQELQAVTALLAEAVPAPSVGEHEIAAYYAAHEAEMQEPERVALRQILVATLNEARDVKRRLGRDPRTFDSVARAQSRSPEAAVGGYMGRFERGQLPPELEAAAFALPAEGTSEPVQSPLGYHVLRVESRQAARKVPLEEARERIHERLSRDKREAAERAFVAEVMARSKVNHEAALRPSSR